MDGGVNVPSLGPLPVGEAAEAGMPMSPQSSANPDEPVRTIFLRGLPADVKEREIHNLFRLVPNYEYSTLRVGTNAQPVAFVTFRDQSSALSARDLLQGIRFDPRSPVLLRIELARSNSKTKRVAPLDLYGDGALRLTPRGDGDAMASPGGASMSPRLSPRPLPGGSQSAPAGLSLSAVSRNSTSPVSSPRRVVVPPLLPSNSSYAGAFGYSDPAAAGVMQSATANPPTTPSPRNPIPRPYSPGPALNMPSTPTASPNPCSTLYIKNLALSTTEADALVLFRPQPGFRKLKLQTKPSGALMLFVEFADTTFSTQALHTLQNSILNGSSIRIEYARHKMGESSANLMLSGGMLPGSPRTFSQPHMHDHTTQSPRAQQNTNGPVPSSQQSGPSAAQASAAGGNAGVQQQQAGLFVVHASNQHYGL
eukprot:TRINITY_DN15418_c0_g1_i1.p1 TRINITY_DN15418_c0_g1~~TRINITY_DN15418_c0_g1_i1.p1  ORF type:complete len:441 (-),score=70.14 TRINITY_DN15418_c0_g1_i1:175-1443(-)